MTNNECANQVEKDSLSILISEETYRDNDNGNCELHILSPIYKVSFRFLDIVKIEKLDEIYLVQKFIRYFTKVKLIFLLVFDTEYRLFLFAFILKLAKYGSTEDLMGLHLYI
ncbi:hypothetical protein K501DRAFT_277260 [Backusella circina FSU 941]|nr:hypothetical protein K501DRAFT_277260 [Backusella circina FSU 941]